MNSLGHALRMTSFGESHGSCVGIVFDGCPAGLVVDEKEIERELLRRRPKLKGARIEEDEFEILSGIYNERTTGAPIAVIVKNKNADSSYYASIKDKLRPGHADFTQYMKYNGFSDRRGGGRFSGRITAGFVVAGYFAKKIIQGIKVRAYTKEIHTIKAENVEWDFVEENPYFFPDRNVVLEIEKLFESLKEDSFGGIVECIVEGVPVGIGEPVFSTLEGEIARAMFAIPAVKGVEFGAGFSVSCMLGSENNDEFFVENGKIKTKTNNAGGILWGISNGMPIVFRVAIKPPSSIPKKQRTVNIKRMQNDEIEILGRHDRCIAVRAVPVVEALTAFVIADLYLQWRRGFDRRDKRED